MEDEAFFPAALPPAAHAEGRSLASLLRQPDRDWPHPAFAALRKLLKDSTADTVTPKP